LSSVKVKVLTNFTLPRNNAVLDFIQGHARQVTGVIHGWDRLRFRGTVRLLAHTVGLGRFLRFTGCLLKDFGDRALELSRQVRSESLEQAERSGRPVVHLNNPGVRKEDVAREIAANDRIKEGLIGTLTAVEPCWSFDIKSNKASGKLELIQAYRKCQHLYHYYQHPVFGFMHVRLQTWLPFNMWVCINGREWLSRQMDEARLGYLRRENCFVHLEDVARTQELLSHQVSYNWQESLDELVTQANPAFETIRGNAAMGYYWSLDESEFASDIMFKDAGTLTALYGKLLRHGMESLGSRDVLRFLGQRVPTRGGIHGKFAGEVLSDLRQRPEGIRIKHRVGSNSVKMYNKQGTVLRVETTLNNPRELKAPQIKDGKILWRRMRKGVSDIARRAQVSQAANERYLEAMEAVASPRLLGELTQALSGPVIKNGRRARGLQVLGSDVVLLEAVADGKFLLHGFRNRDLQEQLDGPPQADALEQRRRSGRISRRLWLLRAHGIIRKVSGTHRYLVTRYGRELITAIQAARNADVAKLSLAA